jgi:glyoxylate/hydroxypyruvate reductase A
MDILLAGSFLEGEQQIWLQALDNALSGHRILPDAHAAQRAGIEVAIVANPRPGSLAGLPRLRLIQSLWAGVDRLLEDTTLPPDVPLARMVDPAMSAAMAETALWAVLSLHRGFFAYARQQQDALWLPRPQLRAEEIPVAVLGLGEMGRTVAQRLAHNGYPVSGWSTRPARIDGVRCAHGPSALQSLVGTVRIVVNLLPLTDATRSLFDADLFACFARGAAFVNLARGAQVVEEDLLAALDNGPLAHAVLDVFGREPLPAQHAFWRHPLVTVLPHVAALTDVHSAARVVAANIEALERGHPLSHLVDRHRGY